MIKWIIGILWTCNIMPEIFVFDTYYGNRDWYNPIKKNFRSFDEGGAHSTF